jgi:hypothetical protein
MGAVLTLKPMVLDLGVRLAAGGWVSDVEDKVAAGVLPEEIAEAARQIYEFYFSEASAIPPFDGNSPYFLAPPVWMQLNFKVCADGSVSGYPAGRDIGQHGQFPDLYLFVDGSQVNGDGTARAIGQQRGLVQGDFDSFTLPWPYDASPWGACDMTDDARAGQPWDPLLSLFTHNDQSPARVKFCDSDSEPYHG